MKYFLTCALALCLLTLPAMAQKAKSVRSAGSRKAPATAKSVKSEVVATAGGAPKLVIESLEHDFGRIKEGRLTSFSFLVKNEGKGILQIENVAPSWGCTATNFDRVVQPGQVGKITLSVTPSGRGQFEKHATVTTNDLAQSSFELIIKYQTSVLKGYRVGSFLFDPIDSINATVKQGEVFTQKVEIINDGEKAVNIEKLDSDNNYLSFQLTTLEPGKRYALLMTSRKDLEVGAYAQLIRLKTSDPNQTTLEIAVGLTVEAK